MFNVGSGEIALIAVVALLILGPKRLPELARGIGKFMREFRRQTDEVRGVVEREFYKMDEELKLDDKPLQIRPASESVAMGHEDHHLDALPPPTMESSQLTHGAPQGEPVETSAAPVPVKTPDDPSHTS